MTPGPGRRTGSRSAPHDHSCLPPQSGHPCGRDCQAYARSMDGSRAAPPTSAVEHVLEESRRTLDRVQPEDLAGEVAAGAMVVDIRPAENRDPKGLLPGARVVDRNGLEGRPPPPPPDRI